MNRRRRSAFALMGLLVALGALLVACWPDNGAAAPAQRLQEFGIVYLHGKASWPGAFNGGILDALREEGARVATPEMPWSFHRRYAATYDQAMAEIDAAVDGLKEQGARRIVVIGHSLGANAAIGYAARRPNLRALAGVVALSPGHLPEVGDMRAFVAGAVARAKALVAEGKGDVTQAFPDMAQGIPLIAHATPAVYLSWFDPAGPAVIPKNAALIGASPHPVPLLWVVGKLDPIDRRGREYAFDAAAKNPKSKYIEVFAGHLTAPMTARGQVVAWINSL